jgi:predicted RNA-binding protein (virulence factor B family)
MKLELNSYTNLQDSIESIAFLKVVSISQYGAFLGTGTDKDILLPHAEQQDELHVDDEVLVYIYLDNNQRPCASMKIEKFVKKNVAENKVELELNQQVDLIIYDETDLGFKALVNRKYLGLLYKNEVFQKLYYADPVVGFVKKIREDGKLDLILRAAGHKATDDIAIKLLELLKSNNNFLNITDRTSPEVIYEKFQTSKKKFKIALGRLYKERVITVSDEGIRLNTPNEK